MPEYFTTGVTATANTNVYTINVTFNANNNVYPATATTTAWYEPVYADSVQPYGFVQHSNPASIAEAAREAEERKAAAIALLEEHLDAEQVEQYRVNKYFHVQTADGERTYRIHHGQTGNVRLLETHTDNEEEFVLETVEYCIHPSGFPSEDTMLAQKLLIETDEEEFLRIANATRLR